ncbi:hypothetical protein H7E67_15360 [Clostridium gasigenes]|uniref:hypothetical protein n=1 Tax=Clostridium gasigenes TaxID=94869 RepID=UPI0016290CEC|nr:hypothetical protein [Clostridium gasigenes]MBB6624817.1 hypothetical protein [Clostridium gasigenes]
MDAKSCDKIETYATLRFLEKTYLKENFIIIRDSDTKDREVIIKNLKNGFKENIRDDYFGNIEQNVLILNYSAFEGYFLDKKVMIQAGIVRDEDSYYMALDRILSNREENIEYITYQNSGKEERISMLTNLLYEEKHIKEKEEDIKNYIKGHKLFGKFPKIKKNWIIT